jgi:hypothetical protein
MFENAQEKWQAQGLAQHQILTTAPLMAQICSEGSAADDFRGRVVDVEVEQCGWLGWEVLHASVRHFVFSSCFLYSFLLLTLVLCT